jgi:hypothetical protein
MDILTCKDRILGPERILVVSFDCTRNIDIKWVAHAFSNLLKSGLGFLPCFRKKEYYR